MVSNTVNGNIRAVFLGLAQAVATFVVFSITIGAVSQLQKWESPADGYLDKVAILLLLGTSALISVTLVLAYPAYLMLSQRFREGFSILLYTILWLIIMLAGTTTVIVLI